MPSADRMPYDPLHRSPAQSQVIGGILERARLEATGALAVFDLDGCLFDNRPRQIRILREYAARGSVQGDPTGLSDLCQVGPEHVTDWSLEGSLLRAGLGPERVREILPGLRSWWKAHFYQGRYMVFDDAMPGAPRFVARIEEAGLGIVYLTGRDEQARRGTLASLRSFGFPTRTARLVMRQRSDVPELDYKTAALDQVASWGRPIFFFDNMPANLHRYKAAFPEAFVVWLDTDHSHDAERVPPGVASLKGFLYQE